MPNLRELFDIAVSAGMEKDPRSEKEIARLLSDTNERYKKLNDKKKKFFDVEKLKNPYSDSRIMSGDEDTEISVLVCGVDIEGPELLLIDRLREKGRKIDAVMAHHPTGRALMGLHEVMDLQVDVLKHYGVPENITEKLMSTRSKEVMRTVNPVNAHRALVFAELLDIPYMNIHTPADNLAYNFMDNLIKENENDLYRMEDLEELLLTVPEIKKASEMGYGPTYFLGSKKNRLGKIAVTEFTGGTGGPKTLYEKLAQSGVGTIISMHQNDVNRKEAEKNNLNVLVSGHMASDSIGINLVVDKFEKLGVEILPISGFIRVSRNK